MSVNRKRLLIAGGGYADIPLILAAKKLGFYVITSGNRPEDMGHHYSHECRLEDFSDKEAMLKLAQNLGIDAICAACNDFSALSAAYVAEKLQLPGHDPYEVSLMLHHKDQYRKFARTHAISSPRAEGFEAIQDALDHLYQFRLPIMVKPVDLTGGKGISKISNIDTAQEKLENAFQISRAKRVVVEEFIEGSRHGLSTFIRDGRVVFYFYDDEYYYLNPYLVAAASAPGQVPREAIAILCQTTEKIASLLNLKTGIFHIQYILKQNEPIIIEICRRAPGDLYIQLVQYATGVDYPSFIVRSSAGMNCDNLVQREPERHITRHCVMPSQNGRIKGVTIDPLVQENIIDKLMWWQPGDEVQNFMVHKLGIMFFQFSSIEEMLSRTRKMPELIRVEMM